MRSDAQIAHARIIKVATQCFGNEGTEASLNKIAKLASVGPGTLYRHFPTREHLIDACMENWEAELQRAADRAVRTHDDPEALLPAWFDDLVAHISVYAGGPARLLRALRSRDALWARRWKILDAANSTVFERLRDQEALRDDADPRLVCVLVCGVATAVEEGELDAGQCKGLLRIVAAGTLKR
ncbi:MAG: TetR/AcrR family transcriptional regulator [Solirubrobacterales bacterium]|nr:TetR/AcrR family transcriptional regulator [Solirubrobacterales bacterium]